MIMLANLGHIGHLVMLIVAWVIWSVLHSIPGVGTRVVGKISWKDREVGKFLVGKIF